jgi:hypothetical protein
MPILDRSRDYSIMPIDDKSILPSEQLPKPSRWESAAGLWINLFMSSSGSPSIVELKKIIKESN